MTFDKSNNYHYQKTGIKMIFSYNLDCENDINEEIKIIKFAEIGEQFPLLFFSFFCTVIYLLLFLTPTAQVLSQVGFESVRRDLELLLSLPPHPLQEKKN